MFGSHCERADRKPWTSRRYGRIAVVDVVVEVGVGH